MRVLRESQVFYPSEVVTDNFSAQIINIIAAVERIIRYNNYVFQDRENIYVKVKEWRTKVLCLISNRHTQFKGMIFCRCIYKHPVFSIVFLLCDTE